MERLGRVWPEETSELLIQSEVVGVAKWRIIRVKHSSMRKKLQNSKDYAESPEFLPALGEEVHRYNLGKLDP